MNILRICTALFYSLFISAIIYGIKYSLITDRKRINLIKEATEKNHMFKGKLVKKKLVKHHKAGREDHTFDITCDQGIYEYEYKGKKYKAKFETKPGHLPKELDLFYVKNPKKATSEYYLGKSEIKPIKYFIISFIIIYLLYVPK